MDTTFGLLNVKSEACRERAICELEKTATQNVVTAFLTKNLKWVLLTLYICLYIQIRYSLELECCEQFDNSYAKCRHCLPNEKPQVSMTLYICL